MTPTASSTPLIRFAAVTGFCFHSRFAWAITFQRIRGVIFSAGRGARPSAVEGSVYAGDREILAAATIGVVITLGVDLASQPKKTAACAIRWQNGSASVEDLELGVDDVRLRQLAGPATKVGIDVPFGWPDAFVAAIAAHHALTAWPAHENRELRFRRTDLFVRERTGRWPLSVSTDRIGVSAFRAARLLSHADADRSGSGKFVEVYPRAARDCFGLGRTRSVDELQERAAWLHLNALAQATCERSEDCFDALVAALVARAAARGLCEPIPESDRAAARREGWIALPFKGSLKRLVA